MALWTPAAFSITIASLATSTANVGRQATIISNVADRIARLKVLAKIKLGTSPTANKSVYLYLISGDGAGNRTDGAGATDNAFTAKQAKVIGELQTGGSPSTGDVLTDVFEVASPGIDWTVALSHDSGVNLDSTGSNHVLEWWGIVAEA